MTKEIPWIKEYPTDELKEIATMSLIERGAYFSLKLIYHTNPDAFLNERTLFAMCLAFEEDERTAVRTIVERLFKQGDIFPFSTRLNSLESLAIIGISQKKLAGIASGIARGKKRTAVRTILESESELELKKEIKEEKKEGKNTDSEMIKIWNDKVQIKLSTGKVTITEARCKRLKKFKTNEEWEIFCQKIISSDFLIGNNNQSWKVNIDWVLKPENMIKIQEGNYDNKKTVVTRDERETIHMRDL